MDNSRLQSFHTFGGAVAFDVDDSVDAVEDGGARYRDAGKPAFLPVCEERIVRLCAQNLHLPILSFF